MSKVKYVACSFSQNSNPSQWYTFMTGAPEIKENELWLARTANGFSTVRVRKVYKDPSDAIKAKANNWLIFEIPEEIIDAAFTAKSEADLPAGMNTFFADFGHIKHDKEKGYPTNVRRSFSDISANGKASYQLYLNAFMSQSEAALNGIVSVLYETAKSASGPELLHEIMELHANVIDGYCDGLVSTMLQKYPPFAFALLETIIDREDEIESSLDAFRAKADKALNTGLIVNPNVGSSKIN